MIAKLGSLKLQLTKIRQIVYLFKMTKNIFELIND